MHGYSLLEFFYLIYLIESVLLAELGVLGGGEQVLKDLLLNLQGYCIKCSIRPIRSLANCDSAGLIIFIPVL